MGLPDKVTELKHGAYSGLRLAQFWEKQIATHGEEKATAFYKHLGLNHLETKGYEWEGLTLSREPKEHEKLCVKGIANAQETAKEQIGKVLLSLRTGLIAQGVGIVKKLSPKDYHTLVLEVPEETRKDLRARVGDAYRHGRKLVAQELRGTKAADDEDDESDELDDLTELTDARVVNDVQARIADAAARFALLGLTGVLLTEAINKELADGSVSYIDRASRGLANRVINIGRGDEARSRSSQWERVEYSALLDQNVCPACAAEDGQEAASEDELTPTPNPECEGGDWCRCFHVFVAEGNM